MSAGLHPKRVISCLSVAIPAVRQPPGRVAEAHGGRVEASRVIAFGQPRAEILIEGSGRQAGDNLAKAVEPAAVLVGRPAPHRRSVGSGA